jgi:hypothetical protein
MKKAIYLICLIISLIPIACSNEIKTSEIKINKSKDTVAVDELFVADLHMDNYSDRLPEFFIVIKGDTSRIPFNDTIKSAEFRATATKIGKKIFKGYAQYYDSLGILKKEKFEITFVVK